MTSIKESLLDFNPWWKEEFSIDFHQREAYTQIQKFLATPQIIALTGLRRVGKTTIMLKITEDAIKKGIPPKNIIYFSFDQFKEIEIRNVLKEYEILAEKDLRQEKYILLLDEIQKVTNWEEQLKNIYDLFGKNTKIIISGSESLFLRKKSKETLAGRIFEFKIDTLTFKEYLAFTQTEHTPIGMHEQELSKQFSKFIQTCGFPELANTTDKEIIKKYIKEGIVEKIVYRDIPTMFKIKEISVIEALLNILMDGPGQIIELSELAKELKLSRQTIANYLTYLEQSFLTRKLYNFSKSRRKTERKLKKYYPAIISTDLLFKEDDFSKSKVFEWAIISQLKPEYFWRDPYKHEVDAVLIKDDQAVPVEIKYGKIDTTGVTAFMKKFNIPEAIILSPNKEEKISANAKTVSILPAFKYLLKENEKMNFKKNRKL